MKYDYKNNKIQNGPKLLREALGADFLPFSGNKVMIIVGFPGVENDFPQPIKRQRPQIIKYK